MTHKRDAETQAIVLAHERMGDAAHEHHLYDDAAQCYNEALSISTITAEDRMRLSEKLVSVLFWSSQRTVANLWHTPQFDSYVTDPEKAERVVKMLLQISRNSWIQAKNEESHALRLQAMHVANMHGLTHLYKDAVLGGIRQLCLMGRFDEAKRYLRDIGEIDHTYAPETCASYYWMKGTIAVMDGLTHEAYESLGKSVEFAQEESDAYGIVKALVEYALGCVWLGDIQRGKTLYEQALLIVRRNNMGWLVPDLCLGYASILMKMGQYHVARDYVLDALGSDAQTPIVETRLVGVGIPLAIRLNDQTLLERCTRTAAIDSAFQYGQVGGISTVSAAFAQLYITQGQRRKASALLKKALPKVAFIDERVDFPFVFAQYGPPSGISQVEALFEARLHLPESSVARACKALFDAFINVRFGKEEDGHRCAAEAVERFDRLGWYGYSNIARSLIPSVEMSFPSPVPDRVFSSFLLPLTKRQQQIAELVLKGRTNREIADELSISERTVEAHMTSIMRHLGVRSRHQLTDKII